MQSYHLTTRTVIDVSGPDRIDFLQGLVTNTVGAPELTYAAILTPQGKFIADFFMETRADRVLLDVANTHAALLIQRLTMYRLRANVSIAQSGLRVIGGPASAEDARPAAAFRDPRNPALGWRQIVPHDVATEMPDAPENTALRVKHMIPETGLELTPDSFILELGFERLNGVDFKKGCFVGQEIVARMKYKTTLRKGLAQVSVAGEAAAGDAITAEGKPVGTLHSRAGDLGLATLRFDRATGLMQAGAAELKRLG